MTDKTVEGDSKDKNHFKFECARLELDSTVDDSTINSDSITFSLDTGTSLNGHLKYCHFKHSGQCICSNLIKYAKAREKRKRRELTRMMKNELNSSSSDEDDREYNKTYRTRGELSNPLRSLESSDPSFYTAEAEPSKSPSPLSLSISKEPLNSDKEIEKNEQISDLNHNESNDQSIIQHMENELFSHLSTTENPVVVEKIKPFFKRLSIIAQEKSSDNEFKECLTEAYQASQQDFKEFITKLTTILEESTSSQDNFSVQYFYDVITKCKHIDEIQNESLPQSFVEKVISPQSISTPKKMFPSIVETTKTTKNINKSQASPLFISTLTRFIETSSPIRHPNISALKSSSPLFDSTSKHNDSSFTYLEKKYVGECAASQNIVPELTNQDVEVLKLYHKQLKALEDSSPIKRIDSSPRTKNNHEFNTEINSLCFTSTKIYENTSNININNENENVDDSILHEYVTQRRRCLETEKMIREIQATTVKDSGIGSDLLNMLTECSDYSKFAKPNSTPKLPLSSKNKEDKTSSKIGSKVVNTQNIDKILDKPGTGTQSLKKKPVVRTVLSKTKVKSSGYTVRMRSPVTHAKQLNFISPHLKASDKNKRSGSRSPSPSQSSCNKIKSQKPVKQKTPSSVPKLIITPSTPKIPSSPMSESTNQNKNIMQKTPTSIFFPRGKYFSTSETTPVQRKKPKRIFFKNPTPIKTPLKEKILNFDNIRSPVRDYINGEEMVVIKRVQKHESSEKNKVTLTPKEKSAVKKKSPKNENIKNFEVGHANPAVIEDVVVDYSIHLTTIAQKKAFYLHSKD